MKFSEERISHLSHLINDKLYHDDLIDFDREEDCLKLIKKTLTHYLSTDDRIDDSVRAKIASLKRGVFEGSREWDVLYKKYYEEEALKLRF